MATNNELYGNLMHVSHLLRYGHGEAMLKVAPGQQRALSTLRRHGSMPQRDMLATMGVSPAALSELLTKLEDKGLITREKSKEDRRVMLIALTPKGSKQAEGIAKAQDAVAAEVFGPLGTAQREQLNEVLKAILDSWESEDGQPAQ